jgi:flavin-dependent dehydrogenase
MQSEIFDVVVIGGGLSGGVAATRLAQAGMKVALVEKEKAAHHKVCGEFLSGEGLPFLKAVGVDIYKIGGLAINRFRIHGPRKTGEAQLPFVAVGVSRKVLDEELLRVAVASGVTLLSGVLAKEIHDDPTGLLRIETSNGPLLAKQMIAATGKCEFKALHKRTGRDSGLVGFKMHLRLKPEAQKLLGRSCDLFVFKDGYGGLSPVENGESNFCFLIKREALKEIGTSWDALSAYISEHNQRAARYLDGAEKLFRNFVTVANVPYGFILKDIPRKGTYCVGDQMAVIPSLTGDGMTIALMTGTRAAEAILAGTPALDYQKQMTRLLKPQVDFGFHMHRLFRSPFLIDRLAPLMSRLPFIFRFTFNHTRISFKGRRRQLYQ